MDRKKLMKALEVLDVNLKYFLKVLELGREKADLWYALEYERIRRDYED